MRQVFSQLLHTSSGPRTHEFESRERTPAPRVGGSDSRPCEFGEFRTVQLSHGPWRSKWRRERSPPKGSCYLQHLYLYIIYLQYPDAPGGNPHT